jgi:hypothetical protein
MSRAARSSFNLAVFAQLLEGQAATVGWNMQVRRFTDGLMVLEMSPTYTVQADRTQPHPWPA